MYKKIDIVIQEFTRIAMPIFFYPIFISSTQTYRDTADNIFPFRPTGRHGFPAR